MQNEMGVELREVTAENFAEVIDLELEEEQEGYVASNAYSLAESKYFSSYQPRAIYFNGLVVGFLMYESMASEGKPEEYDIFRLMIDKKYQRRGLGRKAMDLVLLEIKRDANVERITICYMPTNPVAQKFYSRFGFVDVGVNEDDETIAEIRV